MAQLVKNLLAMRETWVWSLNWEDLLEKGKATHSSILAWRIPWTVQSMGSQRVGHDSVSEVNWTKNNVAHCVDMESMLLWCKTKLSTQKKQIKGYMYATFMDLEPKWSGISNSPTESSSVMSASLLPHWLYCPWNSLDQNTEVGNFPLLQGIFLTQWSNPGLLHCRQILYQLSHKRSPGVQES